MNKKIDIDVTAYQIGPVVLMCGAAAPGHDDAPGMLRPVHRARPLPQCRDPQMHAPRRPDVRRLLGPRTTRPSGRSEGVRVTDGIRRIIEDWRTKGVSPEETAQSLRIPIDEVKAIILQAHPAPAQPKRPEFLEPRYALEKPAGIGDNRRES